MNPPVAVTHPFFVIEFRSIQKSYRVAGSQVPALAGIDLAIAPGEVFGVIGQSGAGKSTLLRLINLLERPDSGEVLVQGQDITRFDRSALLQLRQKIGMIFQHFNLLSAKTVEDNVAWPLQLAGRPRDEIRKRVAGLLDRVGLADQARKYPAQLSGGQKQRVGIARALATGPSILLSDEATSALDPETTRSVLDLLASINRELGLTIVLITHEMDVIRRICDRVAVIDAGRIVECGKVTDVFLHPQHPVTRRFVRESEHVDEAELSEDFRHVQGRVVRLTFTGDATYTPLLGDVARETGVDFSILAGRIDRIKNTPYGQLTVAYSRGDVPAALRSLTERGVIVEEFQR